MWDYHRDWIKKRKQLTLANLAPKYNMMDSIDTAIAIDEREEELEILL